MHRLLFGATSLCLLSSLAMAQNKPSEADFKLVPNPAFLTCLSGGTQAPQANVKVTRGDLNDTAVIQVSGLKPDLDFDLFTVQRSSLDAGGSVIKDFKGFGLAWYQSDLHSDDQGNAKVTIRTILLDQIFGFDSDKIAGDTSTPLKTVLKPTNTFHMGFWFNDPKDAAQCGFDVTKPTPFNGEHRAGPLAMISLPVEPQNLGPLCTSPSGDGSVDDSGSSEDNSKFACNP